MNKMNKNQSPLKLVWIFLALNLLVGIIAIALNFTGPDAKGIVYVDAVKLLNEFKVMKDARKSYEAKTGVWKANLDSLKTELESKIADYQAKQSKLSVKEKQLTEELLQTKQQQFINYQQIVSDKIQKEDQQLTTTVLGKVNDYIKKYGEDKGYDIIMAATQYGNIVYSKKGKDITDQVLEGLNKEYAN